MNNLLTELNQLIDLNPDVINPWNYYWDIKLFSKLGWIQMLQLWLQNLP